MLRSALVAATLAAGTLAVPLITSPAAGASLPASANSITVEWKDDGKAPKIAQLKSFTVQLIVGGNTDTDSVSWEGETLRASTPRPLGWFSRGIICANYGRPWLDASHC